MYVIPYVGFYVIVFLRMVTVLIKFFVILLPLFLSFTVAFHVVLFDDGTSFTTFDDSLYSTFLMILNMTQVDQNTFSKVLHAMFVFMVPVMLFNFLIALMADALGHTTQNRGFVEHLYRVEQALWYEHCGFDIRVLRWILKKKLAQGFQRLNGRLYVAYVKINVD